MVFDKKNEQQTVALKGSVGLEFGNRMGWLVWYGE